MTEINTAQSQEAALAELMDNKPDAPLPVVQQPAIVQAETPQQKISLEAGPTIAGIIPRNLDEAWRLSAAFVRARMVPDSYKGATDEETTAKIMIGVMKGLEVGLAPVSAISTIMVVNNRPSIWGDGAVALIQRTGKMEYMKEALSGAEATDEWTATCTVKRLGQEPVTKTFTWREALRGGLTNKGPWKQYPQRMLQMRARAWALRDVFADCLNGLAIAEEARDMPAERGPLDTSSLDDQPTKEDI